MGDFFMRENYSKQYLLTEAGQPGIDVYVKSGPGFNWHPIAYILSTHCCVYPPFTVFRFSLEIFLRFFIAINSLFVYDSYSLLSFSDNALNLS